VAFHAVGSEEGRQPNPQIKLLSLETGEEAVDKK